MNEKAKMTVESFIDNKELRERVKERIGVLDKVKNLILLPSLECMTVKQVADYYEVDIHTVQMCYNRNKDEIDMDGVSVKSPKDFKEILKVTSCDFKNCEQKNGKLIVEVNDDITLEIPNRGIRVFPKRAILRIGMLLRDSRVAKEVRTQLLNTFEMTDEQQRTEYLNEETTLLNGIGYAFGNGTGVDILQACMKLDGFRKRYINEIEMRNAELKEQNEKIEGENKALSAENHILAADVLKWTDRASANRMVRVLASLCFKGDFRCAYSTIYKEMYYRFGVNVNSRCDNDNKKQPRIAYIKDNEWIYLYKTVVAICEQNKIDVQRLFADAKIDISSLNLQ